MSLDGVDVPQDGL